MRYPTAKPIDQFPCFLGESIYAGLEDLPAKPTGEKEASNRDPKGKAKTVLRITGKPVRHEKNNPNAELTVTKYEKPSRAAKTGAALKTGDGKQSNIKKTGAF